MGKMFDVFNYWKDKCITEHGEVLIEYGYKGCDTKLLDSVDSIPVIEDWGEPSCFACGKVSSLLKRSDYPEMLNAENFEKQIWDSKEVSGDFDRAHIIPKALGGENNAKNIFCLCGRCHKESPDTRFPREFFRWIYKERKNPRQKRLVDKAFEICRKENILPLFDYEEDMNVLKNINSHGGSIVDSSIIATLVGCARERNESIINNFLHKNTHLTTNKTEV